MKSHRLITTTAFTLLATLSTIAFADDASSDEQFGPMFDAGDPRAVPILLRRLAHASSLPLDDEPGNIGTLLEACRDCAGYQLDEAGPAMVRAYRAMPSGATSYLNVLTFAAARYRTPAARSFQQTLLNDPRVKTPNDRVPLLATLAEGGDASAIASLGVFVEGELQRLATTGGASGELTTVIPLVRSAALRERLGRIAAPTDEKAKRTLDAIVERLALNDQSPTALMDLIEHAPVASTRRVGDALLVLGRVGTVSDLERLRTLPLGEGDSMRENDRLLAWRDGAVASIKRLHWRELIATTRPTAEAIE